jgi:hypothetical protein
MALTVCWHRSNVVALLCKRLSSLRYFVPAALSVRNRIRYMRYFGGSPPFHALFMRSECVIRAFESVRACNNRPLDVPFRRAKFVRSLVQPKRADTMRAKRATKAQ